MSGRNQFLNTIKKLFTVLKRLFTYNIATIMFGALLLYMIITVVLYSTSSHVTSYQVTVGPLTKNPVCKALALREEQIVPAGASGYVEYYAREGMQVRKEGSVYALTTNKKETETVELSEEQLEKMRSNMANFSYGFSDSDFYDVYSFKYELQGSILQAAGIVEQDSDEKIQETDTQEEGVLTGEVVGNTVSLGGQRVFKAPEAGVVVYSTDGYESLTEATITEDAFNEKSYKKTDLLTSEEIAAGDPVYKVITSENWTLMIPLTDKLAAAISGRESIKIKFIKDGESQNGSLSIIQIGSQKVARVQLQNGMPRYASDRFLEVELVINTQSGLKIPLSSVIEKEFYTVPREFLAQGDNGEGKGFIRELDGKGDSSVTEFVDAVIYKEVNGKGKEIGWGEEDDTSGYCYVDKETFKEGDILKKPDSSETYTIGKTEELQGVYGMNKGYAVFRQINILDQNEEYCIVSQGTTYGLRAFDYIVLDGESVKEEEILH